MVDSESSVEPKYAQTLKALHQPGNPLVLTNIYDISSLNAILPLNNTPGTTPLKAIATASYAIAECQGVPDAELTLEQNLAAIAPLARAARQAGLPLSVDLQDGYGDRLEKCIREAIHLGVAGANIEDSIPERGFADGVEKCLYPLDEQVGRLKRVLQIASEAGVMDFVLNARSDVMKLDPLPDGALEETIRRGKAYLEAGATTVFVWGGARGLRDDEVRALVAAFEGRLAVKLSGKSDGLSVSELADIGVARISIGPSLWMLAMKAVRTTARRLLEGGKL